MKSLVFCMLIACAAAQWWPYSAYPAFRSSWATPAAAYWAAPAPVATQYHGQDAFGQATYGYAYPGQAASNFRDAAGNQVGSYAYINPEGKEVKVSYTAGYDGFKVLSNDLPVAPKFDGKAPEDTPEVKKAKDEFFKLHKEAKREKRQIWSPYTAYTAPVVAAAPAVTSYVAPVATPVLTKSKVDTLVLEKDDKAKTPADTKKLTEKVLTQEFYTPSIQYKHAVKAVVPAAYSYPAYSYPAYSWGLPAAYPAAYPATYPVASIAGIEKPIKDEYDSIKVEAARKKRQILTPFAYVANHKPEQFKSDFEYSSVDLNKDGQPDNKPFYYSAYPYNTFGYSYPFYY